MARMSRTNCLGATLLVAFVISGCQTPNKWSTAWKERWKPKQQFQGVDGPEEVTYWPYKSDKGKQKMTELPDKLKAKMARKTEQSKQDKQLAEIITAGDQFRKNGQYEDARLNYNKALILSPDNPDVNHRMAIVADMEHQYLLADEYYKATLRVNPRDVNVLSDFGYSYMLRGNSQQAELTFKEALLIEPTHKGAMGHLGTIYAQQNRYPEAVAMFRAGATESETQQYLARLFPQGRSIGGPGAIGGDGHSPTGAVVAESAIGNQSDPKNVNYKQMSFAQIQAEMSRQATESKQQRLQANQRELDQYQSYAAAELAASQPGSVPPPRMAPGNPNDLRGNVPRTPAPTGPQKTNPLGLVNLQPGIETGQRPPEAQSMPGNNVQGQGMPTANSAPPQFGQNPQFVQNPPSQVRAIAAVPAQNPGTEFFRGNPPPTPPSRNIDPQIQHAWNGQMSGAANFDIQQATNLTSSAQMATQVGMSAGPGGMFPIVQGTGGNAAPSGEPSLGFDSRFGAEFQQPSQFQNAANWQANPGEQSKGVSSNQPGTDEGFTVGPPSPSSNWGAFATDNGNLQNTPNPSGWSSQTQTRIAGDPAGSGFDSSNGGSAWGQNDNRKSDGFDLIQSEISSAVRGGNSSDTVRSYNNEGARPYNGAWPNSNSLPPRPTQNGPSFGRSSDNFNGFGANPPMNTGGAGMPDNQDPGMNNSPGNSLPQWPYAKNR